MWHRFNPNPRGSSVGDCVVRAVAAATGRSWEQAYISLALTGYAIGDMPSANRTWGAYLQKQGYKRRMVEADCTTCYTVADFAREYPRGGSRKLLQCFRGRVHRGAARLLRDRGAQKCQYAGSQHCKQQSDR